MDYCTVDDVKENLKGVTVSATSAVTTTALGNIITQESAIIDAYVQQRYDIPPTATSSLTLLKKICIDLCVYRVTKILQPKEGLPAPDGSATQVISHSSAYQKSMKMLENIGSGVLSLPDENKKNISGVSSTAVNDGARYVFDSSEKQW